MPPIPKGVRLSLVPSQPKPTRSPNLLTTHRSHRHLVWMITRALLLAMAISIGLGLLGSMLHWEILNTYAVHAGMIFGALAAARLERKSLHDIGADIRSRGFLRDAGIGFVWGGVAIFGVIAGMVFITHELPAATLRLPQFTIALAFEILFWLVVAIAEEILFRGYIFSTLQNRVSQPTAVVVTAVLFGAIHLINPDYYWFAFLYAALVSGLLTGFVLKRGHLGLAIGFHFAWNLLQSEALFPMPAQGGEWLYVSALVLSLGVLFWALPDIAKQAE